PPVRAAGAGDERGHVDLLLAGNTNALEGHLGGRQWLGRIESHLGTDAIAGRWIELGALAPRHDYEIAVSLKARRHRPFDLRGIMDVDVLVHDDHVLDVVVPGKGTEHDVL